MPRAGSSVRFGVMLVRGRLLRLLRLLVALAALFVAHPSVAATVQVDRVVLVAEDEDEDEDDDRASTAARPAPAASSASSVAAASSPRLSPLQSIRALRERAYLRNCALLR